MIYIILFLFSFIFSTTHLVPEEYSTIQAGIDAAVDGDMVLVNHGIYYENIHLTKSIVLTSYAIFDNLENWKEYDSILEEWNVVNDNINNTVIDGGTATNDYGSCVLIYSPSGDCISPEVIGFTIQNGLGTLVARNPDTDEEEQQRIGAGILFDVSDPTISFNQIIDNGSAEVFSGGGTYGTSMEEDWSFNNRDLNSRVRCEIDEFNLVNNLYDGNDALYGNTFANVDFEETINMSGSIFDVYDCNEQIVNSVSEVWINLETSTDVNYTNGAGQLCAFTSPNVYVDSNIEEECLIQDCGFQNNPFKTIARALEMINPTANNPITIHLSPGTYSPQTGENFPIPMISNVYLNGQEEGITIIDAQQTNRVIIMDNSQNNIISNLTITGGATEENSSNRGGGIAISFSNPIFNHVSIIGNEAYHGGGMALYFSNPILNYVSISNNFASASGGILLYTANPILNNVIISNNIVTNEGGGMGLNHSDPILNNVTISENIANVGGGMHLTDINFFADPSDPVINNSIIWGNSPESIFTNSDAPLVTYSDIEGGWSGQGNININPLFVDPANNNFSLNNTSPCIDSGNPNAWYQDSDGTRSNMGATGGMSVLPNFISYDFGEIGSIGSEKQFTIFNYKQTSITIESVEFSTSSFVTNTYFPITIGPLETGIINIEVNNSIIGSLADEMTLTSNDLPNEIFISLFAIGTEGNVLNGNMSGLYPTAIYRISGDITIASNDVVILQPGSQFLFDGVYNFYVYGTLQAIGTGLDSIIFDNFGNQNWMGITLDGVSNETVFEYVHISGAQKDLGGGMYMISSNPILKHMTITGNSANSYGGGGLYLSSSNPDIKYVNVIGNSTGAYGGGIALDHSNPTLTYVTISENTAFASAGIYFNYSNPQLNNVVISRNTNTFPFGFGAGMALDYSSPILTNVTIVDNSGGISGGGMFLRDSNPSIINSIIWDNNPGAIYISSGQSPIVFYSDIEGGWDGEGNINLNPLFTNSDNGDFTLQEGSPCIDAGTVDLDGDGVDDITNFIGSAPDMGAFEFFIGSMLGDLNDDGIVNVLDIITLVNIVVANEPYNSQADLNNDGVINIIDIIYLVNIVLV